MHGRLWVLLAAGLFAGLAGCVTAPEKIEVSVGGSSRPAPVDSSRVPETRSHEEARGELVKAYQHIQYLERESLRMERKAAKYKRQRDECEERLEKHEDD